MSNCFVLGGWDTVAEVPADGPLKYKVEDLIHKREYRFRIKAVSKIGASEPATFAKSVIAKDPWGKHLPT